MERRDRLKSFSQSNLRPRGLTESDQRLNSTAQLTPSLPGLRQSEKATNPGGITSADLSVTNLKSDLDNVVEQIVQKKQTKIQVRKSVLMSNQSPTDKIKTFLGKDDSYEKVHLMLQQNLSKTQLEDNLDVKKQHTIIAEYKKNTPRHPSRSHSDSDHTLESSLPLLKAQDKSILHQIREHEKEGFLKQANKSVRQTIMELEKLAVNDKEMIELQRKTIYVQQLELQELKRKFIVMQRNMQTITNSSKHLSDEITLVNENRVVLELHSNKALAEKEQLIEKLHFEVQALKGQNSLLQSNIKKLLTDHNRESKANRKYLQSLIAKQSNITGNKQCQTDDISGVSTDERGLYAMINQINAKNPVKKARLPLTKAEDELVIASRMVKEKNRASNASAMYKDFLDGSVIRETIGLKARESTHANVAVQCDSKVPDHLKYLAENLQTKIKSLGNKDQLITSLKQQLEDQKALAETKYMDLVQETTLRLKAEHQQIMSMIIKEKDNNQQKVVANLKAQRDEQCLLKEAALQEIENLKTAAALSLAEKNNQRISIPVQTLAQSGSSTPVSSLKYNNFGSSSLKPSFKQSNFTTIEKANETNNLSKYTVQFELPKIMNNQVTVNEQSFTLVQTQQTGLVKQQENQTAKRQKVSLTREIQMQTDQYGQPIVIQTSGIQSCSQEPEQSRIILSKTSKMQYSQSSSILVAKSDIRDNENHLKPESRESSNYKLSSESQKPASNSETVSRQRSQRGRTPTNERIPTKLLPQIGKKNKDLVLVYDSQYPQSDFSQQNQGQKAREQNSKNSKKMASHSYEKSAHSDRPIIHYVKECPVEQIKEIAELKIQLQDLQKAQASYFAILEKHETLQGQYDDIIKDNQDLRWQLREVDERHEIKLNKLREQKRMLRRAVAAAQENIDLSETRFLMEREKCQTLLDKMTTLELTSKERVRFAESEEQRIKQELRAQAKKSIEFQFDNDYLKSKLSEIEEKHELLVDQLKKEIMNLKQSFIDLKKLFEKKLSYEKNNLEENTQFLSKCVAKLNAHASCLGCDQIKTDSLMLLCGHNICHSCLTLYSKTDHPRSSVRCEVCSIETKVTHLSISLPNRAICTDLIEIKQRVEMQLNYDMIGETVMREVFLKNNFDRVSQDII